MSHSQKLRLEISSRFDELDLVDSVMDGLLQHLGFGEDDCSNLSLAVREAAANAVLHGNRLDPSKGAKIDAQVRDGRLQIRVTDDGAGFDVDALPDPLAPENLLKPTGRGILLMRNFMDEVTFEFPGAGGTIVAMSRSISPPDEDS